jgi:hypothetical protein
MSKLQGSRSLVEYNLVIVGEFDIFLVGWVEQVGTSRVEHLSIENLGSIYLLDRVQIGIPFDMRE